MIDISIDRGGTFTDIVAYCKNQRPFLCKILSQHSDYGDSTCEGVRLSIQHFFGPQAQSKIDEQKIRRLTIGTTIATNALLELKGSRTCLAITKGFKDLLEIGDQTRPRLFDLAVERPPPLYQHVIEVEQRIEFNKQGYKVAVQIDTSRLKKQLEIAVEKGMQSLAVVLLHSCHAPQHQNLVGRLSLQAGFKKFVLSHRFPHERIVERGYTTVLQAYLSPIVTSYVDKILGQFKNHSNLQVAFMQSDGSLVRPSEFSASRALLSGPAGGMIAYAKLIYESRFNLQKKPVIGFDMGGTSTDVSRFQGQFQYQFQAEFDGRKFAVPKLLIKTVAAGGGSRLYFQDGLFRVGPESSGSNPGPVAYRNNGFLSVTDANLMLGRLVTALFPNIFGPTRDQPLDKQAVRNSFEKLRVQIKERNGAQLTIQQIAWSFIQVANEKMAQAVDSITRSKGFDPKNYVLTGFGGAAGQHICGVAQRLKISKVIIDNRCSVLSAEGIGMARLQSSDEIILQTLFVQQTHELLQQRIHWLVQRHRQQLQGQTCSESWLKLKYEGTNCSIQVNYNQDSQQLFHQTHEKIYKFSHRGRRRLVLCSLLVRTSKLFPSENTLSSASPSKLNLEKTQVYLDNKWITVDVYPMGFTGQVLGPAIFIGPNTTLLVQSNWRAYSDSQSICLQLQTKCTQPAKEQSLVDVTIFGNRFMSIAQQMGIVLQRTAISTNIKQRLDFSCAIFDSFGNLVANAPHIPVHLGSMSHCVKHQIQLHQADWQQGDVFMTNHPKAGGTHLPDITLISAIFIQNKRQFYVASRGHHADIGGITPGSMPPFSKSLLQEGVAIESFKVSQQGQFKQEETEILLKSSRCLIDNLSDLKAQMAANCRGITLLQQLVKDYSLQKVNRMMRQIQQTAASSVNQFFSSLRKKDIFRLKASDQMDDGTPICLQIDISNKDQFIFDFSGSGYQSFSNCNAPKSVTSSAVMYSLNCLIGRSIPLNHGFLQNVTIKFPDYPSILSPSQTAAVVGGNVLTSQRIVDVILQAFGAAANSYGDMNNLTFGNSDWSYYQTIGGGSGATKGRNGASGVQCHMTNTKITDPQVFQRRFPVVLQKFGIRKESGGKGQFSGGDGLVRMIRFKQTANLSFLGQRRARSPKGLFGGQNGKKGLIYKQSNEKKYINLGGKANCVMEVGELIVIQSSGGGGFGIKKH